MFFSPYPFYLYLHTRAHASVYLYVRLKVESNGTERWKRKRNQKKNAFCIRRKHRGTERRSVWRVCTFLTGITRNAVFGNATDWWRYTIARGALDSIGRRRSSDLFTTHKSRSRRGANNRTAAAVERQSKPPAVYFNASPRSFDN